jgi:hypothetical protein
VMLCQVSKRKFDCIYSEIPNGYHQITSFLSSVVERGIAAIASHPKVHVSNT